MPSKNINGNEIFYNITGKGNEYLVFLNGIGMTESNWKPIYKTFSDDYKILIHDFKCQLLSTCPDEDFPIESHAHELKELLSCLDIEKAHIIGTSYGSEVAMIFAYTYPESVLSLTVIDGVSETNALMRSGVNSWKLAAKYGAEMYLRTLIPWVYSDSFLVKFENYMEERIQEAKNLLPDNFFSGFIKLCDAFFKLDITDNLKSIKCPTLVIVGEEDLIKPPKFSKIITDNINNSRYVELEQTGHAAVIEKPGDLSELIQNFLNEIS